MHSQQKTSSILDRLPQIIQGGMGVGVSDWRLAKVVSKAGELGVVSGTGIDTVLARRLQLGDAKGHLRRALRGFPAQDMAKRVLDRWFIPGGKSPDTPFKLNTLPSHKMSRLQCELLILANYVEVALAKEGHDGLVGINYLEKIQLTTLPSLLGAMLGGVDFVLMGAGIPKAIPGVLDSLSKWEPVELALAVNGNIEGRYYSEHLDPKEFFPSDQPQLRRPKFVAIVSSDIVARAMLRKPSGAVDGLVIERHFAGGHNAPPRRVDKTNPQFSQKDEPNLSRIRELELPFWLAGSYASPTMLAEAKQLGATGIQVGTAFAFCRESGITPALKRAVLESRIRATLTVQTDFEASPTGYPFKLVHLKEDNLSTESSDKRERVCDLGYLREIYVKADGNLGYRCPAEPIDSFLAKGGCPEQTHGSRCLCNGLMATIGVGQHRNGIDEAPMVTSGDDLSTVDQLLANSSTMEYSALDVLAYLKGPAETENVDTPARSIPYIVPGLAL